MQNKVAITILAVLIGLVSLYQLSFTYKATQVEKAAKLYAAGNEDMEKAYLDSLANKDVYNVLGIGHFTYRECKELELNMGLDLRGGMNVTMEVDVADVLNALSESSQNPSFVQSMSEAKKMRQSGDDRDFITLFGECYGKISPNVSLADANIFTKDPLKSKINVGASNAEVLNIVKEEANSAIDNIFLVLSNRIDQFGVVQPSIRKSEIYGRIVIELPGIKDAERVKNLLERAAVLEFYETFDNTDFIQYLANANQKILEINNAKKAIAPDSTLANNTIAQNANVTTEVPSQDTTNALINNATTDSIAMMNQNKAEFKKTNPLFAILQPSVDRNGNPSPGSVIGIASVVDTSEVNKLLAMPQVRALFPRNSRLVWEMKPNQDYIQLHALKIPLNGRARLDGTFVTDARKTFEEGKANPSVSMNMNGEGAREWAKMTKENIDKCIAIVLDGKICSSPRVNGEIKGGSSVITGNFDIKEADDLANVLKSGKVMAPAHIIASEVVGPSLGQESIQSGMWSFIIAFALILIYMLFFYSKGAGLAADVALLVNLFFLFGVLASFGAVLTLPGIAGIVLTMGMSVDANVLIYERISEEMRGGKSLSLAIKAGYNNAYSAIIDSNVTTLLTGFILYYFGEGPIKGFATTLIIGIFTSLFTAIFISRLILDSAAKRGKNVTFETSLTKEWLRHAHFNFIDNRKIGYIISTILIVVSLVSLFTKGLDKGIDFVGGRTYIVELHQNVNVEEVSNTLASVYGSNPEVKTFGGKNQVKITTKYKIQEDGLAVDEEVQAKLYEGLKKYMNDATTYDQFKTDVLKRTQKVGPAVASSVTRAAIYCVLFAIIAIFLYIMIRFSKWQYSAGASIGLIHDATILLGMYSLFSGILPFSLEIDQAFIAAILTVIGYSINDTVVIFDRLREYFKLYPKRNTKEVTNSALNSTLRRTFSTSLSTAVVLIAIFVFGGTSIRGFVFALLIGVVVGTYSSLFVATPIAYDLRRKFGTKKTVFESDDKAEIK